MIFSDPRTSLLSSSQRYIMRSVDNKTLTTHPPGVVTNRRLSSPISWNTQRGSGFSRTSAYEGLFRGPLVTQGYLENFGSRKVVAKTSSYNGRLRGLRHTKGGLEDSGLWWAE